MALMDVWMSVTSMSAQKIKKQITNNRHMGNRNMKYFILNFLGTGCLNVGKPKWKALMDI